MKRRLTPKGILHHICHILDLVVAALMVVGLALAVVNIVTDVNLFKGILSSEHAFKEYIERVFTVVIGIEFLEMLCTPTSDSVIQTLIFLVARHMIVGETTPVQDLISIFSIVLLVILRRWLHASREDATGIAPLLTVRKVLGHDPESPEDSAH